MYNIDSQKMQRVIVNSLGWKVSNIDNWRV